MLNLIRADLYKSFHRAYLFVMMAAMSAVAIFVDGVLAYGHSPLQGAIGLVPMLLMYPLFLIAMFADITTAEENKEHTLKNTIAYGVSRSRLFLAKNVSTVLTACSVAFVTIAAYLIGAFLLLRPTQQELVPILVDTMQRVGTAFLIYIAAAVLATLLAAVIRRNTLFTFAYFGILLAPSLLLKLLSLTNPVFGKINRLTLFMQSQIIQSAPQGELVQSVWLSLGYIVVFLAVGLFLFRRQEIN